MENLKQTLDAEGQEIIDFIDTVKQKNNGKFDLSKHSTDAKTAFMNRAFRFAKKRANLEYVTAINAGKNARDAETAANVTADNIIEAIAVETDTDVNLWREILDTENSTEIPVETVNTVVNVSPPTTTATEEKNFWQRNEKLFIIGAILFLCALIFKR